MPKLTKIRGSRLEWIISGGIVLVTVLFLAISTPYKRKVWTTYSCRICGAGQKKYVRTFLGVRCASGPVPVLSNLESLWYAKYIATPHKHEWWRIGSGRQGISLRGPIYIGHSTRNYGPYPRSQAELTRMALKTVSTFRDASPTFRRRLYTKIRDATTRAEINQVYEVFSATKTQDSHTAKSAWREWLNNNP